MKPLTSLFITTYEMPRHLELVCAGIETQSEKLFEVLFCDDGSGSETGTVIADFQRRNSISVTHLWQQNLGFRKCKILNQAVRQAKADVFIFLDGDCIPHRHFVRDHLEQQEQGRYLAGRRVELGRHLSQRLSSERIRNGFFDYPTLPLIQSAIRGDTQNLQRSVRLPWPGVRRLFKMDRVADLKGCNYSLPRKALEDINGFDETYEGYGREDTDVELRLQNYGYKIKSLKGLALQYHVWHPRREFTPANELRLEDLKSTSRSMALKGLY